MGERIRNILGQVLSVVSILLVAATFLVNRYEAEIMRHDTTAMKVLLIIAALSFIVGVFLLMSTENPDSSDST